MNVGRPVRETTQTRRPTRWAPPEIDRRPAREVPSPEPAREPIREPAREPAREPVVR